MRMSGNRVMGNAANSPDHFSPMIELAPVTHRMRVAATIALKKMDVKVRTTLSVI